MGKGDGGDDKGDGYYSGYSAYYSDYYSDEGGGKETGRSAYSGYSYSDKGGYSDKGYDYYTYSGEGYDERAYDQPPTDRAGSTGSATSGPLAAVNATLLGAAPRAAAAAAATADGTHVGLGIQLQEPEDGETAGAGFRVTRLIRGAPGDACGLICEGDVLVAVDGRSIVTTRFSAVSALLRGNEVRSWGGW